MATPNKFYRYPLNWYKENISLPDFLIEVHGFEPTSKSSTNYPKLRDPATGTVYLIRTSRQQDGSLHYIYFHPEDLHSAKTIIDFVMSYHNSPVPGKEINLGHVRKYLDSYVDGNFSILSKNSNYKPSSNTSSADLSPTLASLSKLYDRSFFHERGIADSTIDHPYFHSIIHNRKYTDAPTNTSFVNVVFTMQGVSGVEALSQEIPEKFIQAISQRNVNFSGCIGARDEALCVSSPDNARPVDTIIFAETMDDNMSYFQLYQSQLATSNPLFISSQGSLTDGQINLVERLLNKFKPQNFILASDRDAMGEFYCCQLLGRLPNTLVDGEGKQALNFEHIEVIPKISTAVVSDQSYKLAYCYFNFPVNSMEDGVASLSKIDNYFKEFNTKYNDDYEVQANETPFKFVHDQINDKLCRGYISFPNKFENWKVVNAFLHRYKFNDKLFLRHRSFLKDFNDDLQAIKGIHKEYKIEDYYNNPKITNLKTDFVKQDFLKRTKLDSVKQINFDVKQDFSF